MADDQLDELRQIADPIALVKRANELVNHHQEVVAEVSAIRRGALNELVSRGKTHTEIAGLVGMTRARVGQLLASGPQPERALLGTGTLTIAAGGKVEALKANPSTMGSAETYAAYKLLSKTAEDLGLKTEYELVSPPGLVHLNRTNLIVLTSPRLLPLVGQVLEADPNLGFEQGALGWYLVDRITDHKHRSPSDSGEPADYAYIGRLPRPDGHGTFLYLAGIHAMGTLGAATYLAAHVEDLYREVKTRRWSALIECRYDPDTHEIQSAETITPVYRHEGV
jgi:hypothetical protein